MDRSELMSMTVKLLRIEAEKLGIKRISTLKKDDLITAILDASEAAAKEEAKKSAEKKSSKKTTKSDSDAVEKETKPAAKAKSSAKKEVNADESVEEETKPAAKSKAAAPKKTSKKSVALKDDSEQVESEEDAEALEKEKKTEKVEEPVPIEPDSVFIDHGAILPEYIPGTCLFALVRDPGTIFVYWNAEFESENGWLLTAYDHNNNILQQFSTPTKRNGRGYFRVPSSLVARVTLAEIHHDGHSDLKLESKVRIAEQMGLTQPRAYDERWIDIKSREVVFEAPAPGYAPQSPEVAQRMIAPAITGGGYDRFVESLDHPFGCSSSRFGSVGAPGSSDLFYLGSSDLNLKKRK